MADIVSRNKSDSLWGVLGVPGLYETIGPQNFYKSQASLSHACDSRFEKAVSYVMLCHVMLRDMMSCHVMSLSTVIFIHPSIYLSIHPSIHVFDIAVRILKFIIATIYISVLRPSAHFVLSNLI